MCRYASTWLLPDLLLSLPLDWVFGGAWRELLRATGGVASGSAERSVHAALVGSAELRISRLVKLALRLVRFRLKQQHTDGHSTLARLDSWMHLVRLSERLEALISPTSRTVLFVSRPLMSACQNGRFT